VGKLEKVSIGRAFSLWDRGVKRVFIGNIPIAINVQQEYFPLAFNRD